MSARSRHARWDRAARRRSRCRRHGLPRRRRRAPAPASRPLLVTVDDLPLAGAASRGDAAARRATTEALLAVLKKHRIPAIAFVIAGNVKTPDDEALLQRWLDEGHEIGSHSHTHPSYTALTSEAYLADVASSRTALSAWLAPRQRTLRFCTAFRICRKATRRRRSRRSARRSRPAACATCRSRSTGRTGRSIGAWADAVASGDAAAIDDVRQDYLAAAPRRGHADGSARRSAARTAGATGAADPRQRRRRRQLGRHVHVAGRARPSLRHGRRGPRRRDLPRPAQRSGPLGLRPLPPAGEAAAGGRGAHRDRGACCRRRRRRGTAATWRRSARSTRPTPRSRRRPD